MASILLSPFALLHVTSFSKDLPIKNVLDRFIIDSSRCIPSRLALFIRIPRFLSGEAHYHRELGSWKRIHFCHHASWQMSFSGN